MAPDDSTTICLIATLITIVNGLEEPLGLIVFVIDETPAGVRPP